MSAITDASKCLQDRGISFQRDLKVRTITKSYTLQWPVKLPRIYVTPWCECLNELVALLMQENTGKCKKWDGILYKGKGGDTLRCLQICPAEFTLKTCGFVPCVESQMDSNTMRKTSLGVFKVTHVLPKISDAAEKIFTDCSKVNWALSRKTSNFNFIFNI